MVRQISLYCINCGKNFASKASHRKYCYECEEYVLWWLDNTCSKCGKFSKDKDRCGRGKDCGCSQKFYKEMSMKKMGPGKCTNKTCENPDMIYENRSALGFCKNCLSKLQTKRGLKSASRIGKLLHCSNPDCSHKGKVLIVNSNGFCKDCSMKIIGKIGKENASKIGKEFKCPICKEIKIASNLSGICKSCHSKISSINISKLNKIFHSGTKVSESFKEFLKSIEIRVQLLDLDNFNNTTKDKIGSIGLIGTNKVDGKEYCLTAGKSVHLDLEIKKFLKILSLPDKQIPYGDKEDEKLHDFGRWYDITHYYKNFKIILLSLDVTEREAIVAEYAWAYQNHALFQFDENHKKIEGTHGYWLP